MPDGFSALTEKEKETLRLIVRGHDAKSMARLLGLSVHTVNERLRDARRKLAVSSSPEAARLLLEQEENDPHSFGDNRLGEAIAPAPDDGSAAPALGRSRRRPRAGTATGAIAMSLGFALVALTLSPQLATAPSTSTLPSVDAMSTVVDAETETFARDWLALLDQGRWDDCYRSTGASFQQLNTPQVWATASEKARAPLGAARSRVLISQDDVPTPPHGNRILKFRTTFANKADAVETIALNRDQGEWRVVGIVIG